MLPSGWKSTNFGEHIDLLNGFAFKSTQYSDDESDIKLLRGDNIEPNNLRWRNVKRWSKSESNSLKRFYLEVGDIVIAMDRTFVSAGLKVTDVKKEDLPCLLVQRVSRIRALPTLSQDIIKYYFSGYQFEQYVKSVQTETAVPHISPTQIKDFNLLLPPLPEQQKIAKILFTWDKAINATEQLIDNSNQQKKALMQQLLTGKKRLFNDDGKQFDGDWKNKTLSDIAIIKKGKALSSKHLEKGDFPVIAGGKSSPYSHSKYTHEDVITISASGAYAGYIAYHEQKIWASDCSVVKEKLGYNLQFIYQYLLLNQIRIYSFQSGGAQPHIYPKDIEVMKIKIPVIQEQQKIVAVLTNADKEINLLKKQLADLQQEKRALMQQLLTGKRRVSIDQQVNNVKLT